MNGESPAVDDREAERLAAIAPFIEQDDVRPDWIEPEPEDHPLIALMMADLRSRVGESPDDGTNYCLDYSIGRLDPDTAFILGYQTAIHFARSLANGEGMSVSMIEIEGHELNDDSTPT